MNCPKRTFPNLEAIQQDIFTSISVSDEDEDGYHPQPFTGWYYHTPTTSFVTSFDSIGKAVVLFTESPAMAP